jgi:hypothetical protein
MRRMCKLAGHLDLSLVINNMWFAGKRTLRNLFGQVDEKTEQYRVNLIRLRDNFLARAAITTEGMRLANGA